MQIAGLLCSSIFPSPCSSCSSWSFIPCHFQLSCILLPLQYFVIPCTRLLPHSSCSDDSHLSLTISICLSLTSPVILFHMSSNQLLPLGSSPAIPLAHRNRSDFCDLRLRCPSRTPEIARFPRQEKAMLHCDLRVRWKVASDLRFRVAISEPKTLPLCGIPGDLAQSTRKSLAIAIVRFWCAKLFPRAGWTTSSCSQFSGMP